MSSTLQLQTSPKVSGAWMHIAYDAAPTVDNAGNVQGDFDERATNGEGYAAFLHVEPRNTFVLVRAPGYQDVIVEHIQMPHDELITVNLVKAPITLSRLTKLNGSLHRMVNERGEAVYGRGADEFLLYKKFLDGEDITPQLAQLQALGCNMIRVMGMFESLGGFNPKAYPNYYDSISRFCAVCERYGLYVLWTACAATGAWFHNDDEVLTHIKRTIDNLLLTNNALFSPVNEQGEHNNSINLPRVAAEVDFGWLIYDMGSYGVDKPCQAPFGRVAALHTTRNMPGMVKDGNIIDQPNHVAQGLDCWIDEGYRMGDEGSGGDNQEFRSPQVAREAAGSAYTALAWFVHSMQGERAEVLTGNTLDCARAAFTAMAGH